MSDFWYYLVKRSVYLVLTVFLVTVIVFGATQVLPGNAADMILGRFANEQNTEIIERQLGLNKPIPVQYLDWVSGVLVGDWGRSYVLQRPVAEVVKPRLIRSTALALITFVQVAILGTLLGVVAAIKRDTAIERIISGSTYVGISLPEFVTGSILIVLFGGPIFGIFPSSGYSPIKEGIIKWYSHLILPSISLTIILLAHVARQTRSEMIDVLQSGYVRTARLKGLKESKVLLRHSIRNGLLPTITVLALNLGYLMGGLVIIEEIFAIPGIGRLLVFAIQNRDIPVLQILVVLIATVYSVSNLGADLLYGYLDPRIEYGGGGEDV